MPVKPQVEKRYCPVVSTLEAHTKCWPRGLRSKDKESSTVNGEGQQGDGAVAAAAYRDSPPGSAVERHRSAHHPAGQCRRSEFGRCHRWRSRLHPNRCSHTEAHPIGDADIEALGAAGMEGVARLRRPRAKEVSWGNPSGTMSISRRWRFSPTSMCMLVEVPPAPSPTVNVTSKVPGASAKPPPEKLSELLDAGEPPVESPISRLLTLPVLSSVKNGREGQTACSKSNQKLVGKRGVEAAAVIQHGASVEVERGRIRAALRSRHWRHRPIRGPRTSAQ